MGVPVPPRGETDCSVNGAEAEAEEQRQRTVQRQVDEHLEKSGMGVSTELWLMSRV